VAEQTLRLMMVHAHPDDEAVATGGTLALYAARGARTILVTCTRGEEGEIVDDELKAQIEAGAPGSPEAQERLALVREQELAAAVQALNISQFYSLGYRDSGMVGTASNAHPLAFANVIPADATAQLIELVRRERPHVLVSYNEYGGYGHPDHIMAARIARLAFGGAANTDVYPQQSAAPPWQPLKYYEIANSRDHMLKMAQLAQERGIEMTWGSQVAKQMTAILRGEPIDPENPQRPPWGSPEDAITTFIDIRSVLPQKIAALRAHRTQAVSSSRFIGGMPEDFAQVAYGTEYFILTRSRIPACRPEDDLFAGISAD
jgi:LmbE family N-acetylglucosaminyl deacetylase